MPRPRKPNPAQRLRVDIDEPWYSRLYLHLLGDTGIIPFGAWQHFFNERIKEYFESESLDLATYAPGRMQISPGAFCVRGSPTAIAILRKLLREQYEPATSTAN